MILNSSRLVSIDLARGIAITLMLMSHCVTGLVPFDTLAGWQLVPIHLLTKFSSTLFFLVFGFSLGFYYLPSINESNYSDKRRKLIFRGIEILVWYKVLTFIQMFQIYDREVILRTILFFRFPDFSEVLGFYGIFLLWFPWVMMNWKRVPVSTQLLIAESLAMAGWFLTYNYEFWGFTSVKSILVEQTGFYTLGQFQRGALVLFGIALGTTYLNSNHMFSLKLLSMGLISMSGFLFLSYKNVSAALFAIANNVGKHPPEAEFITFTMGGAFLILAAALALGSKIHVGLYPFIWIGQKSLQAFIFHIFVIFVGYRYLLNLRHEVTYGTAMVLTGLLFILTSIWCYGLRLRESK